MQCASSHVAAALAVCLQAATGARLHEAAARRRWDLMESGAGILPHGGALEGGAFLNGVQYTMQAAAAAGLTVVRAFGHGHDLDAHLVLQPSAGDPPLQPCHGAPVCASSLAPPAPAVGARQHASAPQLPA